jgi:hypothetical protein
VSRALRPLALLVLVVGVAACSESDDASFAPVTDPGGNTVTVEDDGEEPRQELRVRRSAGDVDRVTQLQETSLEMAMGGQRQSVTNPPIELDLRYVVDEATDDRIELTGSYEDIRIGEGGDPAAAAQLRGSLDALREATAHTTITRRGSILEGRMEGFDMPGLAGEIAEQLTSSMAENAQSLSMPFPVEAVGIGARWRVETATEIGGLPIELTTVIELTELDDERAAGTVEQALRFVPGEVEVFGTQATVVSGELAGIGTIEWDLVAGIVPRSDITTTGTTVLEVSGNRVEQRQEMRIALLAR